MEMSNEPGKLDTPSGMEELINSMSFSEVDDETLEYQRDVANSPSSVASALEEYNIEKDPGWNSLEHRWCLADMPEGDFPRVYAYTSLKSLVSAIASRDGTETAIWPLYGIPLRVSKPVPGAKGKVRYLLLPNSKAVIIKEGSDDLEIIDQALIQDVVELEEEGWLGDPSYFNDKDYFIDGYVSDDAFTADPDMEELEGDSDSD